MITPFTPSFTPPPAADPHSEPQDLARAVPLTQNLAASRRGLLLAPLLAALPASLLSGPAQAIDPNETQVTLPDQYQWKPALPGAPPRSVETVPIFGATDKSGPYVVVIRWYPGYMSAPHTYVTDRLCFVLSGTWWVNSGEAFEPAATVPVPAGGFVRRSRTRRITTASRPARRSRPSSAFSARRRSSLSSSIRASRHGGRCRRFPVDAGGYAIAGSLDSALSCVAGARSRMELTDQKSRGQGASRARPAVT